MNDGPAISVIMSVYNAGRYLREAVESVLAQTFTDFEFLIVDDGSTDGSPRLLQEYERRDPRIRLTVRGNKGLTRTLNEALAVARGEFIARMDCDDVALPERFEAQREFLLSHPDVVCAGSYWQLVDAAGRLLTTIRPPTEDAEMQRLLLRGHSPICHPAAMFRRDAAARVGGYDETFTTAQDVDLWLRLGEVGKLSNVPRVLLKFRLHQSSVSETKRVQQRSMSRLACERAWARRGIEGRFEAEEPWRPGRDRHSQHRYAMLYGWWAFNSGERRTALLYALKAIARVPWGSGGWTLLLCSIAKPRRATPAEARGPDQRG
jgi:glycosyltransferase involved in cell wall biosynthesis